MPHTHNPELEPEPVTGGWLRAARHTLGLSIDQLATILDVSPNTLRHQWEFGKFAIPEGVRAEVNALMELTDAAVDSLRDRAESITQPAIVVYHKRDDVPEGHMARTYGLDWWDRVAFSVARLVPDVMVGHAWEIADAYDHAGENIHDVHADPCVIALYTHSNDPVRSGALIR